MPDMSADADDAIAAIAKTAAGEERRIDIKWLKGPSDHVCFTIVLGMLTSRFQPSFMEFLEAIQSGDKLIFLYVGSLEAWRLL